MIKQPEQKLKKGFLAKLDAILGPRHYSCNLIDQIAYARDANFRSAIKAHYGIQEPLPSVITWPETEEQISQLIKLCIEYNVAITPYGGGSGVCGGAMVYDAGLILDLKLLNKVKRIDEERLFAVVESGIGGLELEKQLQRRGFTLGHFPSSILAATLGGYIATRSAGQLSSKYGKIEDMIIDLKFIDGLGKIHQTRSVSREFGLDCNEMFIGSEGTLGIATEARLKIFPLPDKRRFQAFNMPNIEYGIEALRRIMQTGIKPDALRLYDELDSAFVLKPSHGTNGKASFLPNPIENFLHKTKKTAWNFIYKNHRIVNEVIHFGLNGCALIIMLEGLDPITRTQMEIINKICKDLNAQDLGKNPAENWYEHRYSVSYKASKLFNEGAFTDTMEVATTWDNIDKLYHGVKKSLKSKCIVLAHISHAYVDGAAIYFTFVAPLNGPKRALRLYDSIWDSALEATKKFNGVISHHHGIGRLKKDHLKPQWGEAKHLYDSLKRTLDPNKIMNPHVLEGTEE